MKRCVFTIVKNENILLDVWLSYYEKYFDNIYVVNHSSTDNSIEVAKKKHKFIVERIVTPDMENTIFLTYLYHATQRKLFDEGYEIVLLTGVDEIIAPDLKYYKDLNEYIDNFENDPRSYVFCTGYDIVQDCKNEAKLDLTKPLLPQRNFWRFHFAYNRPALSKHPVNYTIGCHTVMGIDDNTIAQNVGDPTLLLLHLRYIDYDIYKTRWKARARYHFDNYLEGTKSIPERLKTII